MKAVQAQLLKAQAQAQQTQTQLLKTQAQLLKAQAQQETVKSLFRNKATVLCLCGTALLKKYNEC